MASQTSDTPNGLLAPRPAAGLAAACHPPEGHLGGPIPSCGLLPSPATRKPHKQRTLHGAQATALLCFSPGMALGMSHLPCRCPGASRRAGGSGKNQAGIHQRTVLLGLLARSCPAFHPNTFYHLEAVQHGPAVPALGCDVQHQH